jgi:hypothetical protein
MIYFCDIFLSLNTDLFALICRKEGQHTKEEVQKRNLKGEFEERERKNFSSKDKSYVIPLGPYMRFLPCP